MSKSKKTIIFVSRLDADCSLGANLLCELAPVLARKYENLNVIIVGGGSEYPKIKARAHKINLKINQGLINCVGRSDNPSKYFAEGALFVGVSRAALEAMAHGRAVILLGNEGYLGLLDEEKITRAKQTNFTCRGFGEGDVKRLLYLEICRYFDAPQSEKEMLSHLSRRIVQECYGAEKMGIETLKFYEKTISRFSKIHPLKIALCGYYGHGNFGDEIILKTILERIKKANPHAESHILNPQKPLLCLKNLWRADLFIFGGGSLLQNATSSASLLCYLSVIRAASLLCRRRIMLANGFGPIVDCEIPQKLLMRELASTINTLKFISARDSDAQKELKNLLPKRKIHLVPDPALLEFAKLDKNTLKYPQTLERTVFFVFSPHSRGLKNAHISPKNLAAFLRRLSKEYHARAVITVLNENEDLDLARSVKKEISDAEIVVPKSVEEVGSYFYNAKFIISQRYHGAMLGAVLGVPVLALSTDPKMHSLCKDFALIPPSDPEILRYPVAVENKIAQVLKNHIETSSKTQLKVGKFVARLGDFDYILGI